MGFKPQFWPTVMTAFMLVALIGLGTWQVYRLDWKTDLIAKLHQRTASPPVTLTESLATPEDHEFAPVRVAGTFLHDKELYFLGRSLQGKAGYHVMTPLRRADGKGYELIDRGWIPFERRSPETRRQGQVEGSVVVEGIVRVPRGQGWFVPDNDAKSNTWYFIDPAGMAGAAGIDTLPAYYIVSSDKEIPGGFPVGRQWRLNIANNHLEYALTWYFLALALIVIYVVYHRQREE